MNRVPVSVLIPTRNEEKNIERCLSSIKDWADEILVVDSNSNDQTARLARKMGATVLQFNYDGGWPKKRQWALETYEFKNDWVFLLDVDEIPTPDLKREIEENINKVNGVAGFYIHLEIEFLKKRLKFGGFEFYKLNLFRKGKGKFEKRLDHHTKEMSDVEIHEHVKVDGPTKHLQYPIAHLNSNNLLRYIEKHNVYSTWEAEVMYQLKYGPPVNGQIAPKLFGGTQAQKKRWVKNKIFFLPGYSLVTFFYHYIMRLGFLDGFQGLVYCLLKSIHRFFTKLKFRELEMKRVSAEPGKSYPHPLAYERPFAGQKHDDQEHPGNHQLPQVLFHKK